MREGVTFFGSQRQSRLFQLVSAVAIGGIGTRRGFAKSLSATDAVIAAARCDHMAASPVAQPCDLLHFRQTEVAALTGVLCCPMLWSQNNPSSALTVQKTHQITAFCDVILFAM